MSHACVSQAFDDDVFQDGPHGALGQRICTDRGDWPSNASRERAVMVASKER